MSMKNVRLELGRTPRWPEGNPDCGYEFVAPLDETGHIAATRAEVSDISNAVLEGCDSILLSDEIAVGAYPDEAVRVADVTIRESEKIYPYHKDFQSQDRTGAIADSAGRLNQTLNSIPIVVTSTGRAAFQISRSRPDRDILVFSHDEAVLRKVCMGWPVSNISRFALGSPSP